MHDNSLIEADVVLFCTGFKQTMSYFDSSTLDTLNYRADLTRYPIVLYKFTFHPLLSQLAFVSGPKGGFFAGIELQARYAAMVFSGRLQLPTSSEMLAEIEKNVERRVNIGPSVKFPHGFYQNICDELAEAIGVCPSFGQQRVANDDGDEEGEVATVMRRRDQFQTFLLIPQQYVYDENRELSESMMDEVERISNEGLS